MINSIVCPGCGQEIELTQAFRQDIEKQLRSEIEKQWTDKLAQKDAQLEKIRQEELSLLKQKQALLDREKEMELVIAKKLDSQRQAIEASVLRRADETFRMQQAEKDKIISDLKNSLADAQRKASQSSQQLQGEVQELDLEHLLSETFREDTIEPVAKGVSGADLRQIVKTPRGTVCGEILWESKRTKAWGGDWISKLKQDALKDKADLAAIVSEVLPAEVNGIGQLDGIHISSPTLALPMAHLLRKILIDVARQKYFNHQRQDTAGLIYSYITSTDFSRQVESLISTYREMHQELETERRAFEKIWKQREAQISRLVSGVSGIYGYLQGVAGPALPEVKDLELPDL